MARLFPLEEFTQQAQVANAPAANTPAPENASAELLEKIRLEGYEAGYKAGWDDAVNAEEEEQNRIGAEFARNLQDMGFTFHEARAHVLNTLEPLLLGMVEKVLPDLVSQTIGHSIIEEMLPLATPAADPPLEVVIRAEASAGSSVLAREAGLMIGATEGQEFDPPRFECYLKTTGGKMIGIDGNEYTFPVDDPLVYTPYSIKVWQIIHPKMPLGSECSLSPHFVAARTRVL